MSQDQTRAAAVGSRWTQLHTSAALPLGKKLRYQLDTRPDGPKNWSGRRREEKILPPLGLELQTLGRPARSQSLSGSKM
jgi:hypothetical protein